MIHAIVSSLFSRQLSFVSFYVTFTFRVLRSAQLSMSMIGTANVRAWANFESGGLNCQELRRFRRVPERRQEYSGNNAVIWLCQVSVSHIVLSAYTEIGIMSAYTYIITCIIKSDHHRRQTRPCSDRSPSRDNGGGGRKNFRLLSSYIKFAQAKSRRVARRRLFHCFPYANRHSGFRKTGTKTEK